MDVAPQNRPNPPKWIERIIEYLCIESIQDEILGDLYEAYQDNCSLYSIKKAKFKYITSGLKFLRFSNFKRSPIKTSSNMLFKSYAIIGFRNLKRQKLYAGINGLSLSLGIMCSILLAVYIYNELSYDQHLSNKERLYRLNTLQFEENGSIKQEGTATMLPLAPALQESFQEIEHVTRSFNFSRFVQTKNNKSKISITIADPSYFDVFSFKVTSGNKKHLFDVPYSVVLSEEMAQEFFGYENAVGNTLEIRMNKKYIPFEVTGVFESAPINSSLQPQIIVPMAILPLEFNKELSNSGNSWRTSFLNTYCLLRPQSNPLDFNVKLEQLWLEHFGEDLKSLYEDGEWGNKNQAMAGFRLQLFTDIHLNGVIWDGKTDDSRKMRLVYLSLVALLILLIGGVNFVSITIGRSSNRLKEIAMRRTIGSSKGQIRTQFLIESMVLSMISTMVGLLLSYLLLPYFGTLVNQSGMTAYFSISLFLFVCVFGLVVGFIAGLYPSILLARLPVAKAFKTNAKIGKSSTFTQFMLGFQLTAAAVLLSFVLLMNKQLSFIQKKSLGFNPENVLVIDLNTANDLLYTTFKNELLTHSSIASASATSRAFAKGSMTYGIDYKGESKSFHYFRVDPTYLSTLNIELLRGRNFNPELTTDITEAVVVNEAFVKTFGWQNGIGEVVEGFYDGDKPDPVVVGVVKDFNFESLEDRPLPALMSMDPEESEYENIIVKIEAGNTQEALQVIKEEWEQIEPDVPMKYSFMADDIASFYRAYSRWKKILTVSTILAIIIAAMGLFGLIGISLNGKTKEFGIRRILGANQLGLIFQLGKMYFWILSISFAIALPLLVYTGQKWLENFAYKVQLNGSIPALTIFIMVGVLLLSIVHHALKTSKIEPIEVLKND